MGKAVVMAVFSFSYLIMEMYGCHDPDCSFSGKPSVLRGRHALVLFEEAAEIQRVVVTNDCGYFCHIVVSCF